MKHLNACNYDKQKSLDSFDFDNLSKPLPKVWTTHEMKQFELGIKELGKDFFKIKLLFLPDKPIACIVEYYYNIWKTTEAYVKRREEKELEKKKKIVEITEPQSAQLFHLSSQEEEASNFSQNNSFESNEEANEKNISSLNAKLLCTCCLKYKNKLSFNRKTNISISSASLSLMPAFNKSTMHYSEHSDGHQLLAYLGNQVNQLNDRKNNNLTILRQYENTINSNGTTNLHDARLNLNKQHNFSIYNDSQTQTQQSLKLETVCNQCWVYWKKYGSMKFNYQENQSSNESERIFN